MRLRELTRAQFGRELTASVVVSLVALPFALGVALASGVPLALGLVSAVVGGVLVGGLAGCRLQVSGPAAGLIVLVWNIVDTWGLAALGVAVVASGALQLAAGGLGIGRWFRAVSPALLYGLLGGIGGLVILGQMHVVLGATPPGGGLEDLAALPAALSQLGNPTVAASLMLGVFTLGVLFFWEAARPARLRFVPGALVAVVLATAVAQLGDFSVAYVELPASAAALLNVPSLSSFSLLLDGPFVTATLALAAVAAVESLLSASATDQLHDDERTDYDRELKALGVGNLVCGALGALPLTGVIVRSSANAEAGARTRLSTILHGIWLAAFLVLAPWMLAWLPIPALAGLLIFIGLKLMKPDKVKKLMKAERGEIWVYATTLLGILLVGLLWGLALGFAVSLIRLLYTFSHLEVETRQQGSRHDVNLRGAATFIGLPKLAEALEGLPSDCEAHIHVGGLMYVDHACHVLLREQEKRLERGGGQLITEWDDVAELRAARPGLRWLPEARLPKALTRSETLTRSEAL
ncbi:MAG: SulP family inorganic anion transporter [Sandaracinaceae bacterium]